MFDGKDSTTNPLTVIMQFILYGTNFPTASINKITTFEKSVVITNFLSMKKVRFLSLAAILALGSFVAPQSASAYTYHVTLLDGTQKSFEAKNSAAAVHHFRANFTKGVLTKRPNGGLLDFL